MRRAVGFFGVAVGVLLHGFVLVRSGSSNKVVMASKRKPATPFFSQNAMMSLKAWWTLGLFQFRSGCST